MGHLKEDSKGVFSSFNIFGSVPDTDTETLSQAARKADIFFVVNASTVELQDCERYVENTVGQRPLVLWNLELDTLRADLGEPLRHILQILQPPTRASAVHVSCYCSYNVLTDAHVCRLAGIPSKRSAIQIFKPVYPSVLHQATRLLKGQHLLLFSLLDSSKVCPACPAGKHCHEDL